MTPRPEKWQFVQFQHKGKVFAARIVDPVRSERVGLRVFFEEDSGEQTYRRNVPFSAVPQDGCWSFVPEAPTGYYADLEVTPARCET